MVALTIAFGVLSCLPDKYQAGRLPATHRASLTILIMPNAGKFEMGSHNRSG